MNIKWTERAGKDLREIFNYINRDSADYAKREIDNIVKTVEKLEIFPDMGHLVSEIPNSNFREVIKNPYRIIYRRSEDILEIVTVIRVEKILKIE